MKDVSTGAGKFRVVHSAFWQLATVLALSTALTTCTPPDATDADQFISYTVNPRRQTLRLYWQDEHGQPLRSLGHLRDWLSGRGQRLVFACNGGMYHTGPVPLGLFIENGQQRTPLDTTHGTGNFYLQPNGVFYLTRAREAGIVPTARFSAAEAVQYATQSGPMLVLDGQLHPAFRASSVNRQIRNGVGLLPDGRLLLVMSKKEINFYDFACYFQRRGCRQALYLDGFVSRAYLPTQGWEQLDGDFGVMLGVTEAAE
ncbi:phosphodiester glycosidase family protein [Hymenobacter guriensis]|uniref:Phosphodiester glycosidase family protein n=1 Tax=Hymenobacter guriensis TaxID=2793065 RepID=A0ABS0L8F2_9BACT|nr:phosphodiester glycosidase family protein [Hymenobacter guriensis]MBG8555632.1 phosphodiester glycosidase family protein [Hymenobacter guriensis]